MKFFYQKKLFGRRVAASTPFVRVSFTTHFYVFADVIAIM